MTRLLWLCGLATLAGLLLGLRALWLSATYVTSAAATVEGETVTLTSPAEARLLEVVADSGQEIHAGEVLARLDREMLEAGVRQAEAELAAAKATCERAQAELEVARHVAFADASKAQAGMRSAQASLAQAGTESVYSSVSQGERVRQAEAELARARAELELAEKSQPELVAQARADLAEAEAVAAKAEGDFTRLQRLRERGWAPASDVEDARFALVVARVRLDAAKERLNRAETGSQAKLVDVARQRAASAQAGLALAKAGQYQAANSRRQIVLREAGLQQAAADLARASRVAASIKPKEDEVAAARAQVKRAEAALAVARRALAEGDIRSPVSGVVVAHQAHQGELVARGTPLFVLLDRNRPCWVKALVSEYQISRIKPGQPAVIDVVAYGHRVFRGRVEAVGDVAAARNPTTAPSAGRALPTGSAAEIAVKLSLDDQGLRMGPGFSARVRVRVR
jgi:multidrug resistance efflux pump